MILVLLKTQNCQAQPQAPDPASVGVWVGFIPSLSNHPTIQPPTQPPTHPPTHPPTYPDEFDLAPIEQYHQSKSC